MYHIHGQTKGDKKKSMIEVFHGFLEILAGACRYLVA